MSDKLAEAKRKADTQGDTMAGAHFGYLLVQWREADTDEQRVALEASAIRYLNGEPISAGDIMRARPTKSTDLW